MMVRLGLGTLVILVAALLWGFVVQGLSLSRGEKIIAAILVGFLVGSFVGPWVAEAWR